MPPSLKIIVLSGTPAALPCLDHLFKKEMLVALLCPAETTGMDLQPLENWAVDTGLPCWRVAHQHLEKELGELIRETMPDLILIYGFPHKVPGSLLQPVKNGGWNVHFSIKPSHMGSICIHQLAAGREEVLEQQDLPLLPMNEGGTAIEQLSLHSVAMVQASLHNLNNTFQHPFWNWSAS